MADVPPLLTTTAELEALVERARAAGRLALDTEFVWERTYRPLLGVVQVATDGMAQVLDAKALPSLAPLFPLLRDPDLPIVLHGGGQDLEIFAELMGEPKSPLAAAEREWVTDPHNAYGITGEDADPWHVKAFGAHAPVTDLLAAGLGEAAWRIWEPLVTGHERVGPL